LTTTDTEGASIPANLSGHRYRDREATLKRGHTSRRRWKRYPRETLRL